MAYKATKSRSKPVTNDRAYKNYVRAATRLLVTKGKIQQLDCYVCANPNSEIHHIDYTMNHNIEWLCHDCHIFEHRMLRIGKTTLIYRYPRIRRRVKFKRF